MRNFFLCFFLAAGLCVSAQQKPTDLDKSPMDISYCPPNYPILKMSGKTTASPVARIIYSRLQKAGREIFGGIVAYNKIWRLGANEATEIEFFRPVKINGKSIAKGRYSMYAVCDTSKWTIILSNDLDNWGLFYNEKKDAMRADFPVLTNNEIIEAFTMYFDTDNNTSGLIILWDKARVAIPFSY